jgi:hypothetical protein
MTILIAALDCPTPEPLVAKLYNEAGVTGLGR